MSAAYDASNKSSTKYRELISKAVSRLPAAAPAMRRELYDRARVALDKQLRGLTPALAEPLIEEEARALNLAIEFVEARAEEAASAAPDVAQNPSYGWLADVLERAKDEAAQTASRLREAHGAKPAVEAQPQARKAFVPRLVAEKAKAGAEVAPSPRAIESVDPKEVLVKLQTTPGVEASALISSGGRMIASVLSAGMEEARVARMGATLTNIGENASRVLERGDAREIIIHGQEGYAVLIRAGSAFLLSLADDSSKLGAIFSSMYEAANALGAATQNQGKAPASKKEPRRSA